MNYTIKQITDREGIAPYIQEIDNMMKDCFGENYQLGSIGTESTIKIDELSSYYLAFHEKTLVGFCILSHNPSNVYYIPDYEIKNFEVMFGGLPTMHAITVRPMIYSLCKKKGDYKEVGKFLIESIGDQYKYIYLAPRSSTDNEKLMKYYIEQLYFTPLKDVYDPYYLGDGKYEYLPVLYYDYAPY